MSLLRGLERLERLGDSDADRAGNGRPGSGDGPAAGGPPGPPGAPGARTRRRPRRRTVALAALAVLVLLAGTAWVVAASPVLGVRTVVVTGTTDLDPATVRAAAGLPTGRPLLRVDTAAVARRVEALPDVASARVGLTYPSTVTVTVVQRAAVVVLTGPARLVDGTGRAFRTVASGPPGLPTTIASGADLPAVATACAALAPAARALVRTAAARDGSVTLTLHDGRTVQWGTAERSGEKAGLLAALLLPGPAGAAPPALTGAQIDLRDPARVVTR